MKDEEYDGDKNLMEFLRVSLVESNIQLKLNEHRAVRRRTQEEETTMDFSVKLSEEKRRPASWIMFMDHAVQGEKFEIHENALPRAKLTLNY